MPGSPLLRDCLSCQVFAGAGVGAAQDPHSRGGFEPEEAGDAEQNDDGAEDDRKPELVSPDLVPAEHHDRHVYEVQREARLAEDYEPFG